MSREPESAAFGVGIVGVGLLGRAIGAQFIARPDATVAAVTDVSDEARSAGGEALAVPPGSRYEDYEAMLDTEDLDGVVITTPHAVHYEQVSAALDRGLHVFCEKPLVLDVAEAVELRDRATDAGCTLMVGFQRHQDSSFRRARERYGPDGPDVEFVTAEITQPWFENFGDTWRTTTDLSGGGFLVDTGRHVVDALLWVTGLNPEAVTAEMAFREAGVDERAALHVEFEGGATADVSVYGDAPAVREAHHIWDAEGATYVEGRGWGGRSLTTIDAEGTEHTPLLDRDAESDKAGAFLDCVETGADPPATPTDAIRVTAVIEAAYESAERGERVEVDLPADARY
jgi:predicted dehydrogenase